MLSSMFTKILVTKAKINILMYWDTERECHALHPPQVLTSLQCKNRLQHTPVQGQYQEPPSRSAPQCLTAFGLEAAPCQSSPGKRHASAGVLTHFSWLQGELHSRSLADPASRGFPRLVSAPQVPLRAAPRPRHTSCCTSVEWAANTGKQCNLCFVHSSQA